MSFYPQVSPLFTLRKKERSRSSHSVFENKPSGQRLSGWTQTPSSFFTQSGKILKVTSQSKGFVAKLLTLPLLALNMIFHAPFLILIGFSVNLFRNRNRISPSLISILALTAPVLSALIKRAYTSNALAQHRGSKRYAQKNLDRLEQQLIAPSKQPVTPLPPPTEKESAYEAKKLRHIERWFFLGSRALAQATIHLDPYYEENKQLVNRDCFNRSQWKTLIPDHPPWLSPLDRFFLKYWFKTRPAWELTEAQRIEQNKRFCKPVE
jgi:hypothetical protein